MLLMLLMLQERDDSDDDWEMSGEVRNGQLNLAGCG